MAQTTKQTKTISADELRAAVIKTRQENPFNDGGQRGAYNAALDKLLSRLLAKLEG